MSPIDQIIQNFFKRRPPVAAVVTKNKSGETIIINSDQVQVVVIRNGKGHVYFGGDEEVGIEIPESDVPILREAFDK
jgi:sRNA-binding carbon storage regulator CsrA